MKILIQKNKVSSLNEDKGFTLVETLIYIAIIGTVLSSFIFFSISVLNSRSKTYVAQEVQSNARTAMNLLSQRIRAATGVNLDDSTFGADPGVLSLIMADSDKNPTVFNLNQNDGMLKITEGSAGPLSITSNEVRIVSLIFSNLTGSSTRENIRIELTVDYNNTETDVEDNFTKNFQTTVGVRQ